MINSALNLGWKGNDAGMYDSYKGVVEEAITEIQWLFDYNASIKGLKNYAKKYAVANSGYVPIKNSQISADLFLDTVDNERTRGYNCVEFDAGGLDLKSTEDSISLLQKWKECGLFTGKNTNIQIESIAPITWEITAADTYKTDAYIGAKEEGTFYSFANNAQANNERVGVLRLAVTERWDEGFYTWTNNAQVVSAKGENGKAKQQTLFFDAETIHLTFQTNDVYLDIAYANDPSGIDADAGFVDRSAWFNDFMDAIGAYGVLIVGILGALIIAYLNIKILGSFMPGGTFAKIIMLLLIVALDYAGIALIDWMLVTIESLGGLV